MASVFDVIAEPNRRAILGLRSIDIPTKDDKEAKVTDGWHICFDVLERLLGGRPIGPIVGAEAMKFDWQRLRGEYARQFGLDSGAGGGAQ